MSLAKLVLPAQIRRRYDPDAAAYIASVEAADGQSLEQGIKDAITGFVVDCKTAGIWNAIQSCCLLCGARTLNGALVPLKGPAPTNFNSLFTNNDYNRETGLKGNGSSKFLNTNFASSSLPQDNFHFSLHISSLSSVGAQKTYMADGGTNMYRPISNNTLTQFNINASFGAAAGDLDMAISTGFCGLSRDNASNFTIRIGSRNRVVSASSVGSTSGTMRIFGRNGNNVMGEFSDGRIAFYSIGEQVNLKALNDCVDKLINLLDRHFDSSYQMTDSDAIAYVNQITNINSVKSMGYTYRKAINDFVVGCKNDNIWNSIKACCVLCGSNTLTGSLIPLIGTAPTRIGFVNSDYIQSLGLKGSIFTKGLFSNRNNNADPQNDFHMSIFINQADSRTGEVTFMGVGSNQVGVTQLSTLGPRNRNSFRNSYSTNSSNTFYGTSRNSGNSFSFRINKSNTTVNQSSEVPYDGNIAIFGIGVTGDNNNIYSNSDARLSFYSIGTSLDLSLLDNRVTALVDLLSNTRTI